MTPTIRFVPGPLPVEVTFDNGVVVNCVSIDDARNLLDFWQNNPPEKRGEKYAGISEVASDPNPTAIGAGK